MSARLAQWRGVGPLVTLGLASEMIYLLYFVGRFPLLTYYQRDTDLGIITGYGHDEFVLFVSAVCLLFAFFGAAMLQTRSLDERALKVILGFGALFAVTGIFVYPLTATDLFSYIAQSWVWVHYHQNPIFIPPGQFPHDPLMSLADGYEGYGSPYGPLGIVVDAIPALLVGNRLLASLLILKALFSAMALGCGYLAYLILRAVGAPTAAIGALMIAWNPLVVIEVSVNGHNDIVMMVLVLAGLLLVVRERMLLGPAVLTAACLVKYGAAFLLPLVLAYGVRRERNWTDRVYYLGSALAWSFAVAAVAYLPFWQGTTTVTNLVSQGQRSMNSLSSVLASLHTGRLEVDETAAVGWVLFIAVYAYVLWTSTGDRRRLVFGCFLALFAFLALAASNVEVWYLLWPALLAAPSAIARACTFAFSWGAELSVVVFGYIFVWQNLNPGLIPRLNAVTYALAFVPPAAVVAATWWRARSSGAVWAWQDVETASGRSPDSAARE